MIKKLKNVFLLIICIVIGAWGGITAKNLFRKDSSKVSIYVIGEEIKDIGELTTIEYLYTNADKFEDPATLFGKDIPFTTKSFVAKWSGSIKAGIDSSKIEIEEKNFQKEIIISIPEAKILSHEIDSESIETIDEKNGLFNKIKIDDVRKFDAISKDTMEKRAIENGILEKALENAKQIIYTIVNTDAVSEAGYTITFKVIEEH